MIHALRRNTVILLLCISGLLLWMLPPPLPALLLLAGVLRAVFIMSRETYRNIRPILHNLNESLRAFSPLIMLASVILMLISAWFLRPNPPIGTNTTYGYLAALIGAALMGLALTSHDDEQAITPSPHQPLTPARSRWQIVILAMLPLLFVAEVNGQVLGINLLNIVTHPVQLILWLGGVGLLVWGLGGETSIQPQHWRQLIREALPVVLIFILALGLRLIHLDTSLRHALDETVVIHGINHLTWSPEAGLFRLVSKLLSLSQVFPLWQYGAVQVFGQNFFGLRVTNAIVGALTVFAVYFLARGLFNRKVALSAALLLATLPVHMQFSRIALAHITDPLFGTLALAFIVQALRHHQRIMWASAGAALGMTQYFFEGGRLLFPVLIVGWLLVMRLRPARLLNYAAGLGIFGIAAIGTMFPLYYTTTANNISLISRLSDSGLRADFWESLFHDGVQLQDLHALLERILTPLRVYFNQPELKWIYYGGNQALINDWLIPLFLLGAFYALWRWRQPVGVLALWIIGAAFGNALMRDLFIYARYVVVLPALAILLAVGIWQVLPLLLPAKYRHHLLLPLMLLVATISVYHTHYYFVVHLPALNRQIWDLKPTGDSMDVVLRLRPLPDNTHIYILDDGGIDQHVLRAFSEFFYGVLSDRHMRLEATKIKPFFDDLLPTFDHLTNHYAIFVRDDDPDLNLKIRALFPAHYREETPHQDIPREKRYTLYFIPKQTP